MTPYGDNESAVTIRAQNFEVTAQYQFDFGASAISYLQSKGKDTGNGQGDQDTVKYADVGATLLLQQKACHLCLDYKIQPAG